MTSGVHGLIDVAAHCCGGHSHWQVCRLTFGKERRRLYDALKLAGASYALCFAAANCYGAEVL